MVMLSYGHSQFRQVPMLTIQPLLILLSKKMHKYEKYKNMSSVWGLVRASVPFEVGIFSQRTAHQDWRKRNYIGIENFWPGKDSLRKKWRLFWMLIFLKKVDRKASAMKALMLSVIRVSKTFWWNETLRGLSSILTQTSKWSAEPKDDTRTLIKKGGLVGSIIVLHD